MKIRTQVNAPLSRLVAVALSLVTTLSIAQQTAPPPVQSPQAERNGDVTLRIRAPQADAVQLISGGDIPVVPFGSGLDLTRDAEGVWQITLDALDSGAYRYTFNVDGVATLDPSNPTVSQSNGNAWSLFYVSGSSFMDEKEVAHGAIEEVHYYSAVLGRPRRMHVYTPPGYTLGQGDFPVLYLLHGAMDSDDSWSSVGRAGFIIDNLIATREARPMIVVMPDGHTERFVRGSSSMPLDEFGREFATDIKPYIEANYRIRADRGDTAIAGLSMGGAQTLEIAMNNLEEYGYVGVFSSGIFGVLDDTSWENAHEAALDDKASRHGLELVWFSTGRDDFLIETTRGSVALLEKHGFDVAYEESAGGHTWINWREYLHEFAPLLFR
jgi:enterochelin esterase-like enzyme